jgi:RNA polymerase sigma-70 factor (ECF subfamily)
MTASDTPDERRAPLQTRSAGPEEPAAGPEFAAGLVERIRQGDVQAFEALYRDSVGRVHALCLRLCGDPTRAEDLVQDVFLRVWEKIGTFEGRSRFSTWLYRLTVNRVTDAMRAELRRSLLQAPEEAAAEVPHPAGGGPEAGFELEDAIRALPPGARLAFVLHDVEGYEHEEIAAMTGIAVGTSKSQLYRARRLLRGRLSR